MNLAARDYVVLVIPDWWSLTLSLLVLWLTVVGWLRSRRINAHCARNAEQMAEASEAYARTDEALAPVQEALGQPAEAEAARARAAEYRVSARRLRERQQGRKRRFLALRGAQEPSAGPGEGDGRAEASGGSEGALRAASGSEG